MRKCIRIMLVRKPMTEDQIIRLCKGIKSIDNIGFDIKEVKQAIHILMIGKDISINDDSQYFVPGITPIKRSKYRDLDDNWSS